MQKIVMAQIISCKGINGELKIKYFGENVEDLAKYELFDDNNVVYRIDSFYEHKNIIVAKLKGINSRELAESLVGRKLYINRDNLPALNNAYYVVDLLGLKVINANNETLGHVKLVYNFGVQDLIEILLNNNKTVVIPFDEASVIEVNIQAGYIQVNEAVINSYM